MRSFGLSSASTWIRLSTFSIPFARSSVVTASMDSLVFKAPIKRGLEISAIAAGIAGAYATARRDTSSALPGVAVAVAYILAGVYRLARFNLTSDEPTGGWFVGVPITALGGGMVSSLVLVLLHYPSIAVLMPLHLYLPVVMFVFALLMISRLRFPKAVLRESLFINVFQVINIALVYYCGIFRTWPEYLFSMGTFTLIAGIIAGAIAEQIGLLLFARPFIPLAALGDALLAGLTEN